MILPFISEENSHECTIITALHMTTIHNNFDIYTLTMQFQLIHERLTIRAAERQNAAPLASESSYSSYSASKRWRSAAAIASSRGSCKSNGLPAIVQAPLSLQIKFKEVYDY